MPVDTLSDLSQPLLQTNIPGFQVRRGKVRDTIEVGGKLLIVSTDRLSAFDHILPTGIPDKGILLTQMTLFWLKKLRELIPELEDHFISDNIADYGFGLEQYSDQLKGRSMLVHKLDIVPIESIVRGYLTGGGWKDYKSHGSICGIPLPAGLLECQKLEPTLFTPSTKAAVGHDENISLAKASESVGSEVMQRIQALTMEIYTKAAEYALDKGIIIADMKLEFGKKDGRTILADEVLTPDSSRFWPADKYEAGRDQESFDKQFVRNWLESESGWDRKGELPPPPLPPHIVRETRKKYIEAYERLTGKVFAA